MNWFKKAQHVYGEWWITDTGDTLFADGDVGEYNHEAYVIEHILRSYFDMDSTDWYSIQKLSDQELLQNGMNQEEINVIKGRKDARSFAMKNWGWIRVADKYVQTWTLTNDTLKKIADGLYEAYDRDALRQKFVIEILSTGKNFSPVPYNVISDGNVTDLMEYIEFNPIAIAKKKKDWIKKAQQNTYLGYKIVGVKKGTNQPYSIYNKEPIDITIGKTVNYIGQGLFLGTSKQFCIDYYSCGTEDEDGELILTYKYLHEDIIKGDPNHLNGEIQVKKATLVKIDQINKEEFC